VAYQNLQVITDAYRVVNIIDETEAPTAAQANLALSVMNDMLANEAADGLRLGYFPQTLLSAICPIRDQDAYGVKLMLAKKLALRFGIAITDENMKVEMAESYRQLVKRAIRYTESDLGELQRPQAGPWGGAGYFL
jgi:hypothetical protein